MSDLMQKLAMSKKIMEVQDRIPRGQVSGQLPMEGNATYNIPQDMVQQTPQQQIPQQPVQQPQPVTEDRISNSKLPDEIKKLMMEHPIQQPNFGGSGPVLSDEVIEGATRLMGTNSSQPVVESSNVQTQSQSIPNTSDLKQMIRDVVRDTVRDVVREELQNSGMITESENKTNEVLSLRVGKHVFEGKVLKIKKLKQ